MFAEGRIKQKSICPFGVALLNGLIDWLAGDEGKLDA